MRLPTVAVTLFTFDRLETAVRTVAALHEHLQYEGPLHLHVSDDGSPDTLAAEETASGEPMPYLEDLLARIAELPVGPWDSRSWSDSQSTGYGGSYNTSTQHTHALAEIMLPLEDDWELTRDLDLTPLVTALIDEPRLNCIRLGYLGWTQPLRGELISTAAGTMLLFDPFSPERHVFAGHPRLETRQYERNVGPWPEGIQAGATEFAVAEKPWVRQGVAWPLDLGIPASQQHGSLFRHIGVDEKGELNPQDRRQQGG